MPGRAALVSISRAALVTVGLLVTALAACGTDDSASTAVTTTASGVTTTAPGVTTTAAASTAPSTAPGVTTSAAATAPSPAPTGVARLTLDLVDESRGTPDGASTPAAPDRALPTQVWYPADATEPAPLIVFAHGLAGHPDKFSQLLGAWAGAGYVVAAPAFPLTNSTVPDAWNNFFDGAEQPADLSFVTDEVLAAGADPASPLFERIDDERIGVGGLSLGGATTYLAGLNEATRDDRFDAAMVLDGVAFNDTATSTFLEPSGIPAFLAHCSVDPVAELAIAERAYALLAPPKYLVVMDGVCHAEAFEDTDHPLDAIGAAITLAFWDTWLAETRVTGELTAVLEGDPALDWQSELP